MMKFNQGAQKAQTELAKKENDLVAPIVEKIKKVEVTIPLVSDFVYLHLLISVTYFKNL